MNIEQLLGAAAHQTAEHGNVLPSTRNALLDAFNGRLPASIQPTGISSLFHIHQHEYPMLSAGAKLIVMSSLDSQMRHEFDELFNGQLYSGNPCSFITTPKKLSKYINRFKARDSIAAANWMPVLERHLKFTNIVRINENPQRKAG